MSNFFSVDGAGAGAGRGACTGAASIPKELKESFLGSAERAKGDVSFGASEACRTDS